MLKAPACSCGAGALPGPGGSAYLTFLILDIIRQFPKHFHGLARERGFGSPCLASPYGGGGGRRGERGWRRLGSAPVRARRSPSNGGNFSLFQLFTHTLIASLAYQQQPNCSPAQQPAAMDTGRRDPTSKERGKKKKINDKKKKKISSSCRAPARGGQCSGPCLCLRGGKWPAKSKSLPSFPQKVWG